MPKKKTKILLISLLILDIVLLGIFSSLFSYTANQISQTIDETNQIKIEIKKNESQSFMRKDIEDVKSYKDKIDTYIIQKDDTVGFIKILENMVATSSLKSEVNSVTYESFDELSLIDAELVRVNINVTGEWKNIQFFLQLLENYPLKISIKKISLDKFADYEVNGKTVPQWSGSFDFTVVKLKDK